MIPYDATQHIQGISQGINNAMPSLVAAGQKSAPGNPDLEAFINNSMEDYTQRRMRGEKKEDIIADYLTKLQGTSYPDATQSVQSVGAQAGTPSLGTPDMSAATATPPNSFGGGSMNGMTPPASAMGGGISSNAQPVSMGSPIANMPDSIQATNDARLIPEDTTPKTVQVPMGPPEATMEPYSEPGKIDMTAGRDAGNKMQTGHGSPIPPMRTRGQQEQALGDIERMKKVENADEGLDIKRMKLEQENQKAIMINMRLTKKDIADLKVKIQGLDQKAQIAVVDMWLKSKAMEQKFKLGNDRNSILKTKAAGSAKIDPRLQHMWTRYKTARDNVARYQTSLMGSSNGNPEETKRLKKILINEMHEYNKQAVELGLPEISGADNPVPEGFVLPEDRTSLPEGEE